MSKPPEDVTRTVQHVTDAIQRQQDVVRAALADLITAKTQLMIVEARDPSDAYVNGVIDGVDAAIESIRRHAITFNGL